jgi:(+)-trans-carveol dehydrogenase
MGKMDGKVALITGGARGQGRSHAVTLAAEGADIIVTDICEQIEHVHYPLATEEDLAETVKLVEALDRRCLSYKADARDAARMKQVTDEAVAELGRLDIAVLNHGIGLPHDQSQDSVDLWDTVIATNLSAVWRSAIAVIPHLKINGGSIIIIGSAAAHVAVYDNAAYVSAKHGLVGLVRSLAVDLADDWVRVNLLSPTNVDTQLLVNDYNIGRFVPDRPDATVEDMKARARSTNLLDVAWMEPEAVSHAVLYLASDEARYITGTDLRIDAGMSHLPPGITKHLGRRMWELEHEH